ncbi:cell envelope integrity protein TolA [Candidatus Fukatsuia symbiotica]|uniref:cell envelope integrity protein TolA n=1 Tax=Candidatus Fukatsuia TaxID=1927833 RepID=UPI00093421E8|nr:cell envelope integrity protein TolA [Candidatus Fukatsuia symbiotica]MEA9445030.1 cell envelope integrity protein TolA [Candidatus Fukatsuia symbiotica]
MTKGTEQNHKLKLAVIVSVILHLVLIALLIWGSSTQNADIGGSGASGTVIDAVMVDPGAVAQQYQRQEQQQTEAKRAQQQYKKRAEKQAEELQQKQAAERQRLKDLEKERLQAQENAKQAAEEQQKQFAEQQEKAAAAIEKAQTEQRRAEAEAAQAKAEADKMLKAAAEAREKAVAEAKKAAAAAAKKQAEAKKAENEAKQKAAAEAKKVAAAAEAARTTEVDDLLGGLAAEKNVPQGSAAAAGQGGGRKSGASGSEINGYLGQITAAIQSRFYDANLYRGRKCDLRIQLSPEGILMGVTAEGGDPALCQAAIAAAKQAKIPKPPNDDVYQVFKNAALVFKP